MASFLLRNHQRFYFSHEFVYCPLKDILRLLNKEAITVDAKLSSDGSLFFENQAFHYLCRSTDLESLSVRQFYEGYFAWDMTKAKKKRKRNGEKTFWRFENTDHFIHPSSKQLKKKKGTYGLPSQCAVKSDKNKLIKVTQWDFPDTSLFRANMLTCPQDQISIKMEQYCQSALSLLMPFRSQSDFVPIGYSGRKPYTNKLREVYNDDETKRQQDDMPTVFTDENIRFLQNLQ
ncbi:hypothetical protein SEMRO_1439_G272810.1 [Seminavis robusta]|uniref:Uncharacterized protein n=1 Tax=Seminavis robusta TaxID=568900 RepID=A0A9N8EQG7_9STRA|nr:hypothetical protein SEMRO_1439_G272810.1 [Seminavis robusta]|eukprot:Sro1439_g272810.1 n/a (232) ;mRNA; r:27758-28453